MIVTGVVMAIPSWCLIGDRGGHPAGVQCRSRGAGTSGDDTDATPQEAIRALVLGLFEAIDAHPWVGAQLARTSWQSPLLWVFEQIGRQVQALRVPEAAQFTVASTLMSYTLGVAGQNAANARMLRPDTDRTEFLDSVATAWAELDPDQYAFTRNVAGQLREHDDRAEFLAGIDLVLTKITAHQQPAAPSRAQPQRGEPPLPARASSEEIQSRKVAAYSCGPL